jgi:hypothetical protein
VCAQALLQLKRRQDRPSGMIFLRYGRTKQGGKSLTGPLGDGAVIVLDHLVRQPHPRL